MGWGWGESFGWGGWMMMMFLVMLPVWAALILGGFALFRATRGDLRRSDSDHGGAQRILEERFARGEIDEAEYARSREVLETRR